jgi:hypothetical protein
LFQRIFIDALNRGRPEQDRLSYGPYLVRQEVNTSDTGADRDIADLVLENDQERLVVENYFTSDGHGHCYENYLTYALGEGRRGLVALLCRDEDSSRQTSGWQQAAVVTYDDVVARLHHRIDVDRDYQHQNPESYSFIDQMHRKFSRGRGRGRMEDRDLLDFLSAMCATGEARRYRDQPQDMAAKRFADDLAEQALERFSEGRELLQRIKGKLKRFCAEDLRRQLNDTLGPDFVPRVNAAYAGIYQWTVNLEVADEGETFGEARLQLKFGPSAWFANEEDPNWQRSVDRGLADYSRLFLTRAKLREIRQSTVTLNEVLDGLQPDDLRLHDEIVELWRDG